MDKQFKWHHGYFILLVLLIISLFSEPCLVIRGEGRLIASAPGIPGTKFSIEFIHSVQKTPVRENLAVEEQGFRLKSTEYQSFGVGLPFLEEEGEFRMEDGKFVMDHMDRRFECLSLRTGVGTQLRIFLGDREYALYEMFPPGTRIDLSIVPLYEIILSDNRN